MILFRKNGKPTLTLYIAVVGIVLLAAWQMGVAKQAGWPFLILCLFVGSVGGLSAIWASGKIRDYWKGLSRRWRILTILLIGGIALIVGFILNHGKPDESADDFLCALGVLTVLGLFGFYCVLSRFLDKLWARYSK